MRRRTFLGMLGSTTIAWQFGARAQPTQAVRRIGVLLNLSESDPETRARVGVFLKEMGKFGWNEGRNLQLEYRWSLGDAERIRKNTAEIIALAPDVILAHGSTIVGPLQRASREIPIVFVSVADPIAGGIVDSLARPGGNATGFTSSDYSTAGKWLELLKQVTPTLRRVAVVRDARQVSANGQLGAISAVASILGIETVPVGLRDKDEVERDLTAFARESNGGMIVTTSATAQILRDVIISLAARYKLPAMYPYRFFIPAGGLMAYGPDVLDQYKRAASYVDRILKGEKAANLSVQQPNKFDLVINLKTAKALGIEMPASIVAGATQVYE